MDDAQVILPRWKGSSPPSPHRNLRNKERGEAASRFVSQPDPYPPRTLGCPILRLLSGEGWDSTNPTIECHPERTEPAATGEGSRRICILKFRVGWDSTNANSQALCQGPTLVEPKKPEK
jgi:hypothetical protein